MLWGSAAVWFGAVALNPNAMLAFAHFDTAQWLGNWTFRYSAAGSMYVIAAFAVIADVALSRGVRVPGVVHPHRRMRPGAPSRGSRRPPVRSSCWPSSAPSSRTSRCTRRAGRAGPFWDQQVQTSETECELDPDRDAALQIAPARSGP